ncbi:hypothetical protein Tco_1024244 [Tanacetum coccineum]
MSLVIAKSNPDYIEAKQATEEIETPSIGFIAPSEFKERTIKTLGAVIKQNNTILYLLVKKGEEVKSIREDLIEVKGRLKKIEKQEAVPQEFGEAIADLTKRLEKVGKKMNQRRVPTLFSVREGTSTDDLPTQDDQVRNYQWTQRRRFELQRGIRRLRGQRYNNTLELMVNPEQQLAISGRRRAQLAPAEVLYSYHRQTARHRVYEHYSEQRINCGEGDQVDLRLCNDQSFQALQREGMQHIHIGLAMIRLHTLHRIGAGTNALVVLQDTRWSNTTRIISTMEVDLAQGTQLDWYDRSQTANLEYLDLSGVSKIKLSDLILKGEGELHVGIAVGKEEFIFMVYEEDYEDESDKDEIHEHDITDSSESEWENPFAVKSGGNQEKNEKSCFHLNEDDELP